MEYFMKYLQKDFFIKTASLLSVVSICMGAGTLCADDPNLPTIIVDSEGNAVTAWESDGAESSSILSTLYPDPDNPGNWTSPISVSNGDSEPAIQPKLISTADGNAIVAWYFANQLTGTFTVMSSTISTSSFSSGWSSQATVTPANHDVQDFQMKINSSGEVVIFWIAYNSDTSANEAWTSTMSTFGGSWGTPVQLY